VAPDDSIWCSGFWDAEETIFFDVAGDYHTVWSMGCDELAGSFDNESCVCSEYDLDFWQENTPLASRAEITGYLTQRGKRMGEIAWKDVTPSA
jgi:hypothetical protein